MPSPKLTKSIVEKKRKIDIYIYIYMRLNLIRTRCKTLVLHPPISIYHIIISQIITNNRIGFATHNQFSLIPNRKSKLSNANSNLDSLLWPLLQLAAAHLAIFIDNKFLGGGGQGGAWLNSKIYTYRSNS